MRDYGLAAKSPHETTALQRYTNRKGFIEQWKSDKITTIEQWNL